MTLRASVPLLGIVASLAGCLLEHKFSDMEDSKVGATEPGDGNGDTDTSAPDSSEPATTAGPGMTSGPDSTTGPTSGPFTTTSPGDPDCEAPPVVFDIGGYNDINPTCLQPTDADVWMYAVAEGPVVVRVAIDGNGALEVQPACGVDTTLDNVTAFAVDQAQDHFFISNGNRAERFRLCLCEAESTGTFLHQGLDALTWGVELFGISTQHDSLVHFEESWSGDTELFGDLGGRQFESAALTWSDSESAFYVAVDPGPGAPAEFLRLDAGGCGATHLFDLDVENVDMAIHEGSNRLFACLGDSHLYEIHDDGTLVDLGDMGFGTCQALSSGEDYW